MKRIPPLYLALLFLAGCGAPPELTHSDCPPPPEPQCNPGVSHAQGIDTAHLQPGNFKYHIDLLPKEINTNGNENAIAFYGNTALLSIEKKNTGQGIWFSEMLPDLHFNEPFSFFFDNKNFLTTGAPCYSIADSYLYFTGKADNDDPNDYDLYRAKFSNKGAIKLEGIESLNVINKKNSFDAQPALSKDGLMIVFASDRSGGNGGVDLWYSTRKSINSDWSEPKVLPSGINTPCDELSPSFSADGKRLYFSSNGHETIGGYDIFSTEFKDGAWTPAENIGAPINTKSDEIFPYQLSDSQFFYTSDQPAKFKGRNIYVLRRTYIPPKELTEKIPEKKILERNIPEKNIPDTIRITGKVELPSKVDTLPDVFVRDVDKNKEIARKQTDTGGGYSFNVEKGRLYDVGTDQKDKFYDMHRIDLTHPTDSIVNVPPLTVPDTLILRINFPFNDASHPYDFIVDEGGNKSEMLWQTSIDLIAKSIKNSSISLKNVILYGHTDSLGTDDYNLDLAKKRAEFVAKRLEERGFPAKLFVIVPKGRTMPVKRNPGENDDTFYLRCRRVEFVKSFSKEKKR